MFGCTLYILLFYGFGLSFVFTLFGRLSTHSTTLIYIWLGIQTTHFPITLIACVVGSLLQYEFQITCSHVY